MRKHEREAIEDAASQILVPLYNRLCEQYEFAGDNDGVVISFSQLELALTASCIAEYLNNNGYKRSVN